MGFVEDLFGGFANDLLGFGLNEWSKSEDRNFTREMYERQLADQRENWRMMNEYNAPSAQMERLVEAGLNPNLIYGSGGVTGTTSLPGSAHASSSYSSPYTTQGLTNYIQLRRFDKDMALADQNIDTSRADAELKRAQAAYYGSQTKGQDLENYVADNIKEYRIWKEHFGAWQAQFKSENDAIFAYDVAAQTLAKLIADVAYVTEQKNLSKAQQASIYKDIEVKDVTIKELMAKCDVDYATAENLYDLITSRSIHDDLDIVRLITQPYGTGLYGNLSSFTEGIHRQFEGNESNHNLIQGAYERLQRKSDTRHSARSAAYPTRFRRYRRVRIK